MTRNGSLESAFGGATVTQAIRLLGVALFLAAIACTFPGFVPITERLFRPWHPHDHAWLLVYAAASAVIAATLFVQRGRPLFIASLAGLLLVLLIPVVLGHAAMPILKLAWMTILCAGLGHRCLRWLVPRLTFSLLEDLLLSIVAGYGLLALLVLALGSLWLLRPVYAYLTLAVLTGLVIPDLYVLFQRLVGEAVKPLPAWWSSADLRLPALAVSVVLVCSFGGFVWAVAPPVHSDALAFHLAIPETLIRHGGLVPTPEHHLFCHIRNADMLFLLGLLIEGQTLPALSHFLFGLLTAGLVCCLGIRAVNVRVGILAGCFFYALPLVTWESGTAYIDLFLTGFVLAAVYGAVMWWKEDQPAWLTLASLMGGLAIGTKLNAAIFAVPIACLVVTRLLMRYPWRQIPGCMARLTLPCLLVSWPWFLQAWVWTGNPVFPMLNAIFQSPLYPSDSNRWFNWHKFGWGTTWPYFIRLPWDLNFHSKSFGEGSVAAFAGMSLLGLPWTICQASRSHRRLIFAACLFLAASLAVFFIIAQYHRYMLPVFTVLALIAALNVEHTWKLISHYRWHRVAMVLGLLVAMVWLSLTRSVNVGVNFYTEWRYPLKLFVGKETPDQFLQRNLRAYEALRFIAEQADGEPPRLVAVCNSQAFYSGGAVFFTTDHNSQFVSRLVRLRTQEEVFDALLENHIEYLMLDQRLCESRQTSYSLASRSFVNRFGRPVFSRNRVEIYRIFPKEIARRLPPPKPLVKNGGFELLDEEGKPVGWRIGGHPTVDASGNVARSAPTAIRTSLNDYAWQRVPVRQDAVYTLSAFIRADKPEQRAYLEFVWFDESEKLIRADTVSAPAGQTWARHEEIASPRCGAVWCEAVVRGASGSEVWFDDVQLSETIVDVH